MLVGSYNNKTVNGGNNEVTTLSPPNLAKRLGEFLISASFSINPYLYVALMLSWIRER